MFIYVESQCEKENKPVMKLLLVSGKIHTHPMEGYWKFQIRGGGLKTQIFKGKYEAKLAFTGGWGVKTKKKKLSLGGGGGGNMNIFWNNTLKSVPVLFHHHKYIVKLHFCTQPCQNVSAAAMLSTATKYFDMFAHLLSQVLS